MPYAKIDIRFLSNPKVVRAGRDARDLYLAALLWSAGELTDGFVPTEALPQIAVTADVTLLPVVTALAERLVAVGLWQVVDGGWCIHDYLKHQSSAEHVKAERDGTKERVQEWRRRRAASINGSNAKSNAVTSDHVTPTVTVGVTPDVTLLRRKEGKKDSSAPNGAGTTDADAPTVHAVPKPNKSGELIGLLKARGVVIEMTGRDHDALKKSSLSPSQVAEAYEAAFRGDWNEQWLQHNLCVQAVIGRYAGYVASRQPRRSKAASDAPKSAVARTLAVLHAARQEDSHDDPDDARQPRRLRAGVGTTGQLLPAVSS